MFQERRDTDRQERRGRHPVLLTDEQPSSTELEKRHTWFRGTHKTAESSKDRTNVKCEVRIPENFNGLYSVQFSKTGDIIATTFGTGAIQVIKIEISCYQISIYLLDL